MRRKVPNAFMIPSLSRNKSSMRVENAKSCLMLKALHFYRSNLTSRVTDNLKKEGKKRAKDV